MEDWGEDCPLAVETCVADAGRCQGTWQAKAKMFCGNPDMTRGVGLRIPFRFGSVTVCMYV